MNTKANVDCAATDSSFKCLNTKYRLRNELCKGVY